MRFTKIFSLGIAAIAFFAWLAISLSSTQAKQVRTDSISGVVTSSAGPEAGVWVIAETTDLPTHYIKEVVTDDHGRYLIPRLPKAKYTVWARGYGLVDSPKVETVPGRPVNLRPGVAPDNKAAALYYPANYWYALLEVPARKRIRGHQPGLRHFAQHQKPGRSGSI